MSASFLCLSNAVTCKLKGSRVGDEGAPGEGCQVDTAGGSRARGEGLLRGVQRPGTRGRPLREQNRTLTAGCARLFSLLVDFGH